MPGKVTATPFAIIPEWLLHADVSDRAVRLYGLLRRAADRDNLARRGRPWLANVLHCSTKSIDRALAELEAVGSLSITSRYDGNRQTVNSYHLYDRPFDQLTLPTEDEPPGTPVTRGGDTGDQGGRHHSPPPSDTGDAPGATRVTPLLESPGFDSPGIESASRGLSVSRETSRRVDPLWEQLVVMFGEVTNEAARGTRNRALMLLRQSGATPDEVMRRALSWPDHFGDATLTPTALAKHWDTLGRVPAKAPPRRQGEERLAAIARLRGQGPR